MKVYPAELRKRVLAAYNNGDGSMRKLSERFMVSLTFVFNVIKNFRQNGHIRPKPHGGGNKAAINEEGRIILSEIIYKKPDMTLKELCEYYEDKCGKKVSISAMDSTLKKMKITRKKKVFTIRKKIRKESGVLRKNIISRQQVNYLKILYLSMKPEQH